MRIAVIVPFNTWSSGETVSVNKLGIEIGYDNLVNKATIKYTLLSDTQEVLAQFLEINGEDYQNWGNTGDPNQEITEWVAAKLNITLV